MSDVDTFIIQALAEEAEYDPEKLTPELLITDDLGLDSLNLVQLVLDIENEFEIEMSDEDIENIKSVQDVINTVNRKLGV